MQNVINWTKGKHIRANYSKLMSKWVWFVKLSIRQKKKKIKAWIQKKDWLDSW